MTFHPKILKYSDIEDEKQKKDWQVYKNVKGYSLKDYLYPLLHKFWKHSIHWFVLHGLVSFEIFRVLCVIMTIESLSWWQLLQPTRC